MTRNTILLNVLSEPHIIAKFTAITDTNTIWLASIERDAKEYGENGEGLAEGPRIVGEMRFES